jgi:hypothetical protein
VRCANSSLCTSTTIALQRSEGGKKHQKAIGYFFGYTQCALADDARAPAARGRHIADTGAGVAEVEWLLCNICTCIPMRRERD